MTSCRNSCSYRAASLEIDPVDRAAQLLQLLIPDVQPEFLLSLGQGDPQPSPRGEFALRAP
jgi:hypothetical protein